MSVYERTDVDYERADEVTDLEHGARLHVCQNRVMGCIEQLGEMCNIRRKQVL
jgi:hypothetical protein